MFRKRHSGQGLTLWTEMTSDASYTDGKTMEAEAIHGTGNTPLSWASERQPTNRN